MSASQRHATADRPFVLADGWAKRDVRNYDDRIADTLADGATMRIIADDAWAWYLGHHTKRDGIELGLGTGCLAPPYRQMWIEATGSLPGEWGNGPRAIYRVGVLAVWFDADEWAEIITDSRIRYPRDPLGFPVDTVDELQRCRWVMATSTTLAPRTRAALGATGVHVPEPSLAAIDADGQMLGWRVVGGPETQPVGALEGREGMSALGASLAAIAVQFLHARNVRTIERRAPELRRGKRSTRGNLPGYRYHVLDVTGLRTAYAAQGGDPLAPDAARAAIAMHTVRGHFKTYTAERPLLGRAVGTYFWQDHVRGSTADRVVEKAYHPDPQEP